MCWHVTKGSGMGLICAGDLSNSAFYNMAEKDYACDPQIQRDHGIDLYARYMDDIIIIASGPREKQNAFILELVRFADCFKVLCESVSSYSCKMLDLHIFFGPKHNSTGLCDYNISSKQTSISIPLAPTSMHHPSVHVAWPASMVLRAHRLSSSKAVASAHVETLMDKWKSSGIVLPDPHACVRKSPSFLSPAFSQQQSTRLVLPYCVAFYRAQFAKVLATYSTHWQLRNFIMPPVGIAWSLSQRHYSKILHTLKSNQHRDSRLYSIWNSKEESEG